MLRLVLALLFFTLLSQEVQAQTLFRISNMDDFNFGTYPGTGSLSLSDQVCIYRSGAGNSPYIVRATGSGAGGAFTVSNGFTTIPYSVTFQGSTTGAHVLTAGVNSPNNQSRSNLVDCGGGTNATLTVSIDEVDLSAAAGGTYTGTLTILLNP